MASNNWNENVPSGDTEGRQLDEELKSFKTTLRIGLDDEHHWTSSAGDANRGTHRYGSARAYVDAESNLTVSGTSFVGRLYYASDTSRFYVVPDSGFTGFLGGGLTPEVAAFGDDTDAAAHYPGQNARWVVQSGKTATSSDGTAVITFSPAYDVPPIITATAHGSNFEYVQVLGVSTDSFRVQVGRASTGPQSNDSFFWTSLGTVSF